MTTTQDADLFLDYLIDRLAALEAGVRAQTNMSFAGPSNPKTDRILLSLESLERKLNAEVASGTSLRSDETTLLAAQTPDTTASQRDSPLSASADQVVVPPGPLLDTLEQTLEPTEELRLLKAGISDVARVCYAVTQGDLSQRITAPVPLPVLEQLKDVVNDMVGKQDVLAQEVLRVTKEVGNGKLGVQARVKNTRGVWKELTDSVNVMTANLTMQVRTIATATDAVVRGQLRRRVTGVAAAGEMQDLVDSVNRTIEWLHTFATQTEQVARAIGVDGSLDERIDTDGMGGIWKETATSVNAMASSLTDRSRLLTRLASAKTTEDLDSFREELASLSADATQGNRPPGHF